MPAFPRIPDGNLSEGSFPKTNGQQVFSTTVLDKVFAEPWSDKPALFGPDVLDGIFLALGSNKGKK